MSVYIKSFSKYFCSYSLKKAISQKKTTVIGIIFNLEKLKRHSSCVDLEQSFNKYSYIYCFFKKDISQIKFSLWNEELKTAA